jgi:glycosyltransferase involved in cell wall biosynthesis
MVYTSHGNRRLKKGLTPLDRVALAVEDCLIKRVKIVMVNNDSIRESIITTTHLTPNRVLSIPVPVDTAVFKPVYSFKRRSECENKTLVLFVGRISEEKGIIYLVKAADIIINKFNYKRIKFIIAGPICGFGTDEQSSNPYYLKIQKLISASELTNFVTFIGSVTPDNLKDCTQFAISLFFHHYSNQALLLPLRRWRVVNP